MSGWRPLSRRGQPDATLDEPTEGLPPYLAQPVAKWLADVTTENGYTRDTALTNLQLRFKLDVPLDARDPRMDLVNRVFQDETFGLDVVDYVLHHITQFTGRYERSNEVAAKIAVVLHLGGSAWEVSAVQDSDPVAFRLSRRAVGPIREVIESLSPSTRAHSHLVEAWNRLSGRNPDESGAYREAIRAVEAVAKPIVLPDNQRATLGTMIVAMRDKPEKWSTTLGTINQVRELMEAVWTGQLDRHGTDDETVPLNVSPEETDAAFAICLNLVRLFAGGHVRRV